MNASSTEISVRSSSDEAALQEFKDILTGQSDPIEVADDPAEIQREILLQIMNATSDDGIYGVGNATGWREYEGVPVEIRGFRWRPSSLDEGSPVYVVVNAIVIDSGEVVVLTTGANTVLAQLYAFAKNGRLPGERVVLEKGKQTASGYYPLQLRPVAGPAEGES